MDLTKIKDFLKDLTIDKIKKWCVAHYKRLAAVGLLIVLIIVVACLAGRGNKANGSDLSSDISSEETRTTEEIVKEAAENAAADYDVDDVQEVNDLITAYYQAMASGDTDAISQYATPVSDMEKGYIGVFSQYIHKYRSVTCYTKAGYEENSYFVSVEYEMKLKKIDTLNPGLDFFYVRTAEDGSLYIDNIYSNFNLSSKEYDLDSNVVTAIGEFEKAEDVLALQQSVQEKYEAALAADEALKTMMETTLPDAISAWAQEYYNNLNAADTAADTQADEQKAAEEAAAAEAEAKAAEEAQKAAEEAAAAEAAAQAQQQTTETVYATEKVNVRSAADETSEKLGSVEGGTAITRYEAADNGWSRIDYNGTEGYIKSEFLSASAPAEPVASSIAAGTEIRLNSATNVRSAMSETSDRVGLAFAGETLTVVESYAEGWTRVEWNGQSGYVKTEVLTNN